MSVGGAGMGGREVGLGHSWWPMYLMLAFQASSNKYRKEMMEKYPDLYCWKKKKASAPFTPLCIYHFIAMLYYWSLHPCMSKHSVIAEFGMSHHCFYFMWQHFHIYKEEVINVEEEEGGGKENVSEEEDMTDELCLECVVHDEEEDEFENDEEDEKDCNADESDDGSS
eukprot:8193860-Ditylum_brightwellii.AAC.1